MLSNLKSKTLLGGRWEVTSVVGEGACAQVYTVRPTQSTVGYELVAKVVPFAGGSSKAHKQQERICNTLNYEYMMYNGLLNGFPFCPRVPEKFYGDDKDLKVRFLVMERMDRDLDAVANSGTVPTSQYIAQLGSTILEGLKWIHQKNFLFIDVKPANFMLKGDKLFFVDFGLVERLQVMPAGKTAPSHTFAGTPTFCSVAVDNGEQSGAHDDLEALGYVLISLTSGGLLPWSAAKSEGELKRMKAECNVAKLCAERGMPEVGELILRCRSAARTVRPDYDALAQLLAAMQSRKPSALKAAPKAAAASKSKAVPAAMPPAVDEAPVTKKRAVSAKKAPTAASVAASAVDLPAFDGLALSGAVSPVGKRSRTTRGAVPAAAEVISLDSPDAPPAPASRPKRGAAKAEVGAASGPFSTSRGEVEDEEEVPSPARASRARPARLSTTSVQSENDPNSGPFSATFKSKSARGRSTSPAARGVPAAPVSGAKASPRAKAVPTTTSATAPSANGKRTFVFSVKKGPCKGTEIVLSSHGNGAGAAGRRGAAAEQVLIVGRGDECDYVLGDDYLSESHFSLVVSNHQPYIVDARSTNGTKLNGGKVSAESRAELQDGDIIKAGKTELVFHITG